ncbi:MAG: glycosyltransferase family 39 protein, partial [Solirubrobacteraceae bacterium]
PVACAAAQRLAGRRGAALAGLLVAVSPLLVWFSQEARAYALATLLATVTVWCTVQWLSERRGGWLAGWAVAAALGLATHYFVVFVVAPELALIWWRSAPRPHPRPHPHRRIDRRLLLATAVVVAVGCALIPLALAQRGTGHADYISAGPLGTRLAQVPKQLLVGYASPHQTLSTVLAAALVLAGAAWPILVRSRVRERALTPLAIGVAAVVVPVLLALGSIDFLDTRNLLPALPALLIAAAVGFAAPRRRPGRQLSGRAGPVLAGVLAAVSLAVVVLVDTEPRYQRADWRDAAAALGSPPGVRAMVVTPGSGLIPLQAYLPHLGALTRPVSVRELDVIALGAQSTGAGIAAPPRGPAPVPPPFHLVRDVRGDTFTALRYMSASPVTVTPATVAAASLQPGSVAALVQR